MTFDLGRFINIDRLPAFLAVTFMMNGAGRFIFGSK